MAHSGQTGGKRAKAPLGQNFLSDPIAVRRIVDALGDVRDRLVIEIGPGQGALTELLAQRSGQLIAIELDRDLAPSLTQRYAAQPNVEILQQDVLHADLTKIVHDRRPDEPGAVVGNLPYYITSDILLHLINHAAAIDFAVVMMQREVAERVAAPPGSSDYGLLSATVQLAASAQSLFTLPPGAFTPPPRVYSSVVQLKMRPRYEELGIERAPFEAFLKKCFAQKRKTLAKNLRVAGYAAARIAPAMEAAQIAADARAEAVALERMAQLYRSLTS
jgi:16S rRNA (adenine1518-N6/adenine1519-N6)-dimethyltransferase